MGVCGEACFGILIMCGSGFDEHVSFSNLNREPTRKLFKVALLIIISYTSIYSIHICIYIYIRIYIYIYIPALRACYLGIQKSFLAEAERACCPWGTAQRDQRRARKGMVLAG